MSNPNEMNFNHAMQYVRYQIARTIRRDGDSEWNQALRKLSDILSSAPTEEDFLRAREHEEDVKSRARAGAPKG